MRLADFVSADRALVPLAADRLPAAAVALFERLVDAGAVSHPERLRARIDEQRPEDLVALGERAFLLHYRSDAVRDLCVAIGIAPRAVRRGGDGDGRQKSARIILVVVAPPRAAALYLQTVGAFARLLARNENVELLLAQHDADSLAALPLFVEHTVRDQLTVRDIMTERPRTVSPHTPLRDAALDMVRAGVGGLPVVDEADRVIGMLSERELMQHLMSSYLQAGAAQRPPSAPGAQRTVRDVMTRQVLCVSPEQPLAEVASMLTNKDVDRVPVVREGRLVGFLTRGDIVRKLIGS